MAQNVIAVLDGEAGSCGKGKACGRIATDTTIILGASITNCMPNAGHTFVDDEGNSFVFRNIPIAIINPYTELFIGPGSAIDMDVFVKEYESVKDLLKGRKIYVHEMVPLIEERHKKYERRHIKSGSTFKGCGAVAMEKLIRDPRTKYFETYKDAVVVSSKEWKDRLKEHLDNPYEYVMLEGAQGCDLGINHSGNFPYTTQRNVSTAQMLADSGIPADCLLQTIMVIRPFPIRISNITNDGRYINSGSYGTGRQLTWTDVNLGALNGVYPYRGNCPYEVYLEQCYHAQPILDENIDKILTMYKYLPAEYKMQLLEGKYKRKIRSNDVDLELALEIERLYWKSLKIRKYTSVIIKRKSNNGRVFDNCDYIIIDLSEMTSVTKKERKIFDLDIEKLISNCMDNHPSGLYLNFAQQLDLNLKSKTGNYSDIIKDTRINKDNLDRYLEWIESECNIPVVELGTGPKNDEKIIIKRMIKDIIV